MSHPHAFHTSCRSGLASNPGFQFNAASPALDRALLSQLAARHAGYHVPRDMPLEPAADDLPGFPVALKVAAVDGGTVAVSRTVYVGREFRGRDGAPDEGRFGNYFSHIVVGDGAEPFDGLLAIELWGARHWVQEESATPDLAELGRLEPGPLDVERVAQALSTAPRGVMAAVLDAAVRALDGGPRLVLVEADNDRAAAWIGWISYALPAAQAQRLTFTTFDGRPRYADDVHVCVTTPACDTAFAAHEIGHSVALVDVAVAPPPARPSLYARVALELAERGTDALATAVRAVPAGAEGDRRGAWLAVASAMTELVEGDELAAILDLLCELAQHGQLPRAAAAVTELPADTAVDRAVLADWARLHRVARGLAADEDSRTLASAALARIVPFAGELPDAIAAVDAPTPTQPGVGNLAPWLSAVEAASGTAASGALIRDGLRLGLVGVNAAVDRRVAAVLGAGLAHEPVQAQLRTIGKQPELAHVIVAITESLAERAGDDGAARQHLRGMTHPVARDTLRRRAEQERSFERLSYWLQAEVGQDPSRRRPAATDLAALATCERDHGEIRGLWGPQGPQGALEHAELIGAYLSGGTQPPAVDVQRALAELMSRSLEQAGPSDRLGDTLRRCDERVRAHPAYLAWWLVVNPPGIQHRFAAWAAQASVAMAAGERDVPEERWSELGNVVCKQVIRQRRAFDYAQGVQVLRSRVPQHFDDCLAEVLGDSWRGEEEPWRLAADLFATWRALPGDGVGLVEDVFARATQGFKRRDLEDVEAGLPPQLHEEWRAWQERHPRASVARALGFRGRRAKDEEAEG
jgi:hypothetical protein